MKAHLFVVLALALPGTVASLASADPQGAHLADGRAVRVQVDATIALMDTNAARLRTLLRQARVRGIAAQIACADEGLSRADVATRTGREHARLANDAWTRGDGSVARRELVLLAASRDASRAAATATEACFYGPPTPDGTSVRVVVELP